MGLVFLVLVVLLLVGGFGGWVGGPWYGGHPAYVGGGLGTVLIIIVILILLGRL